MPLGRRPGGIISGVGLHRGLATPGGRGENSLNAGDAEEDRKDAEGTLCTAHIDIDDQDRSEAADMPNKVLSGEVVDAAMKVHSALGPGLLEGAYEACLAYELRARGLHVRTQVAVPLVYSGLNVNVTAYRADLLVEQILLVELKCATKLLPVHEAQLLSYLRMGGYRIGLLINFSALHLRDGLRRKVNNF